MLVEQLDQLPHFPAHEVVVVDIETTSFDDGVKALNPFQGHRIAGVALANEEGTKSWYLPVRHHSCLDARQNLSPVAVFNYLRREVFTHTTAGHNYKFDLRFFALEGVSESSRCEDTIVLARLVECDRFNYKLDGLLRDYHLGAKGDVEVKGYLRGVKSQDYGVVPIRLMHPYAEGDALGTARLRNKLLAKLPAISLPVWEEECELLPILLHTELRGITIDVALLKQLWRDTIRKILPLVDKIKELTGHEINPLSPIEVHNLLVNHCGVTCKSWKDPEEKTRPQWGRLELQSCGHPVGPVIADASALCHFVATYCEGWFKRLGHDGKLHPEFKQHGTKTGRMSSTDPNFQNVPPDAEVMVRPREGYALVYFDYSQMEYRLFAHYTNDPTITQAYRDSPKADFHQHLATMLGVDRQFAKQLNFAFLYGLGKSKLLKSLAGVLALSGDPNMYDQLRSLVYGHGIQVHKRAEALDTSETMAAAEAIYNKYHETFPSIVRFQTQVKRAMRARGWVKNYFGRVYKIDRPHKGVNYIIQGGCADLFKVKLNQLHRSVVPRFGGELLTMVHDSLLFQAPVENLRAFYLEAKRVLEDMNLRVPMFAEGRVSANHWASCVKLADYESDPLAEPTQAHFEAALQRSVERGQRHWGE